jgi:phage regulator Rha-like protein
MGVSGIMSAELINYKQVEKKIVTIRGQEVILDNDVAELYGVETKRVNEAVNNNPDKFPKGYILELNEKEFENLRSKFSTTKYSMTRTLPKAFTEKGLYMLATILKSPRATQTTIAIVETFTKIRELTKTIAQASETSEKGIQKSLMQKGGEIIAELLENSLETTDTETSFEINFAVMKFKHIIKQKKKDKP